LTGKKKGKKRGEGVFLPAPFVASFPNAAGILKRGRKHRNRIGAAEGKEKPVANNTVFIFPGEKKGKGGKEMVPVLNAMRLERGRKRTCRGQAAPIHHRLGSR